MHYSLELLTRIPPGMSILGSVRLRSIVKRSMMEYSNCRVEDNCRGSSTVAKAQRAADIVAWVARREAQV